MQDENKIPIIVVVGPTASGKTSLAIDIAKKYNGEIVSADSMQIYKEMNIGTAKPTIEEMDGVRHHLIDFVELDESFSLADYAKLAHEAILDITTRGKLPVMAGGTGLYIDTVIDDIKLDDFECNMDLRLELEAIAREKGVDALFEMLKEVDEESSETIDKNNIPRVIRAIEVYKSTGMSIKEHQRRSRLVPSRYNPLKIGLNYSDRQKLYDRINLRVDLMLQNGLLDEAKYIFSKSNMKTASQAIAYKELFSYFKGEYPLETAVENLKQSSRRYAKRQLTWFRKDEKINWFYPDLCENIEVLKKNVYQCIDNFIKV